MSDVARFDATQASGGAAGSFFSEEHHRDLIVSGLVHFRPEPGARVVVDIVGGASYVQEDTVIRTARASPLSPVPTSGPFDPERSVTRETIGAVFGVDLDVRIARHLTVGPTARLHVINRAVFGSTVNGFLGLGATVLRAGALARVEF